MDANKIPPDTCPLCKQRTLLLEEGTLNCSTCKAEAEFDAVTRRVRYTAIPQTYAQFEVALKDKWLTRREVFKATEVQPLPTVVFFPIIVSLLALCALFGLIGIVLAVRPSMGTTRDVINDAYAKQLGINQPVVSPLAAPLTSTLTNTLGLSPSVALTSTVEVTQQLTLTPSQLTLVTPIVGAAIPNLAPTATFTPQPTAPPPPGIPTRPPTFTAVATLPGPPPNPTVQIIITATPVLPTSSPVLNSSLATPTANPTGTPTPTSTPLTNTVVSGQTATSTPTPTATPITQTISSSVGISNVLYIGDRLRLQGDEYVDLFNRSASVMTLTNYKLRVASKTYDLPPGIQIPAALGCRIYTSLINSPPPPFNGCGGPFSFNIPASSNPEGIYPDSPPNVRVELLDGSGAVIAFFP